MKKTSLVLSLALAIVACQEEELVQPEVASSADDFVASVEDYSSATKTTLNEHKSVIWSANDQISIFNGNTANNCYQIKPQGVGTGSGVFSLAGEKVENGSQDELVGNLAVYPYLENTQVYQIYDNNNEAIGIGIRDIEIPAVQTYEENSFGNGSFPMIAITKDKDDHNLKFRNAFGVLKLQLLGDIKVSKIQLRPYTGNDFITGIFNIETRFDDKIPTITDSYPTSAYLELNCGEGVQLNKTEATPFYIALPPYDFTGGFRIRVWDTDNYVYTKTTTAQNIVERSGILAMPPYLTGARIEVSTDVVSVPNDGSPVVISLTATEDWTVEYPSWLEVSPSSGETGTYEVSVSMASDYETYDFNNNYIHLRSYDYNYAVAVVKDRPLSTTKEVIENGVDGEEYRISGYVSKINNTTYGNWYIEDETGELYIYGTTRYGGYYCPYAVGDYVTLQGPRATYNNTTIEFVNATIIGYEHTLVRFVRMDEQPIPGEGGEFKIRIECPQDDVDIAIPEDAQSWLSASSVERVNDYLIDITFTASENTSIFRSAEVKFEIFKDGRRHFTKANVQQNALDVIKKVTIAEFLAAPVDANQKYELTGVIENIANTTYGNFDLRDETGTVYVYGLTKKGEIGPNDKSFSSIGLKVGDTVTLVGVRNEYRGTPQVGGQAYYVSHISN